MTQIPVLLITFNRPQYAPIQLEALRQVKPRKIYLASDGPRNDKERALVEQVRTFYKENVDWECEIKTQFQSNNLGCSEGPIRAMKWFFEHESEGIILEDDIIPHSHFFTFVEELLPKYRNDNSVISISGCNLGFQGVPNYYLFSRIMNMWGWATWADRFFQIDFEIKKWRSIKHPYLFLYNRLRNHVFDVDLNWLIYWKNKFDETVTKPKDSITWWDYQFIFNQVAGRKYTIFPARNLVSNIGFGSDASHTIHNNDARLSLVTKEIEFPLVHQEFVKADIYFEEQFIKKVWAEYTRPNFKYYVKKFLKKGFKIYL